MLKRTTTALLALTTGAISLVAGTPSAQAAVSTVYTQPGDHYEGGRYWQTECEMYSSSIVRCRTEIWATKVVKSGSTYVNKNGWVFNNTTYLPASRAAWGTNPLANNRAWTDSSGRQWKTQCDTATTGTNACRTSTYNTFVAYTNGAFTTTRAWVLNNMVLFSTATTRSVTTIPARSAVFATMPVESTTTTVASTAAVVGPCRASYYASGSTTANGEHFYPDGLTAAHRTLAFGTKVKVTNTANGASVIVRINDRGPYVSGRCMDLSRGAMREVGGISAGVITITYQVVS